MKPIIKRLFCLTVASALGVPGVAIATNGYFMPGFGAKSIAMGGVGIAYAQDSLATGANPAGIADVGTRVDLGISIFNPERRSAVWDRVPTAFAEPGGYGFVGDSWSKNRHFLIPNMGMTMQWDDRFSIGIAALAAGGMNTTYETNFFKYGTTGSRIIGVDLMQLLMPITGSWRINDEHAVGVSIILAGQRFASRGLEAFPAFGVVTVGDEDQFTNKGYDYSKGYGYRIGWRGKFLDERITLGATYASRVEFGKFKNYRGLFADQGEFDLPDNYGIGIALKPIEDLTVAADIVRINFSSVQSVGNRGPSNASLANGGVPALGSSASALAAKLGQPGGMGFGWNDQFVYKIGVDWKINKKWTVRAGYNYGKSPIPDDQLTFNLLAPATTEKHFMAGFTFNLDDESEVTLGYMHAQRHKQSGCGFALVDCAEFEMFQRALDISYALKW